MNKEQLETVDQSLTHVVMRLKENHGAQEKHLALLLEFLLREFVVMPVSSGVISPFNVKKMDKIVHHLNLAHLILPF